MKKTLKEYILGFISAMLIVSGTTFALNTTTLYDVLVGNVRIVIDGNEIEPVDVNGNSVAPIIHNGTTYLPVRAVANAFGKAVYWDGAEYTVYLGEMKGRLEYPTLELRNAEPVRGNKIINSKYLTDNYKNRYKYANTFENGSSVVDYSSAEYLLNMKYSRFKATLYVIEGSKGLVGDEYVSIIADGKTIYTSATLSYSSKPIDIDVDITGCNQFVIEYNVNRSDNYEICLGNAGFYQ